MLIKYVEIKITSQQERVLYLQRKYRNCNSYMQLAAKTATVDFATNGLPPIEETENTPPPNAEKSELLNKQIACALNTVRNYFCLDENEKIEEDHFSFLSSDWCGLEKGTPLLRRTTSLSTVYFFFEGYTIDLCDVPILKSQSENIIFPSNSKESDSAEHLPVLGNPIASIALSVAGAIAGKLATMAIDKIMGTSVPDYFKDVYDQMRIIISEELDQHMIQEISDEFLAAQMWNHNHYLPLKNRTEPAPPSQQELEDAMNPKQQEFYRYLAKLMDVKVAPVSLAEFLIGANIHLAFVQELAIVTKKENYSVEFCDNIKIYIDHVTRTWSNIVSARRNQITVVNDKDCEVVDIGVSKCSAYWASYDQLNQTTGIKRAYDKKSDEAKAKAEADAENRKINEVNQLRIHIGQPDQVIQEWTLAAKQIKAIKAQ